MTNKKNVIIAIDGVSASGKGSVAKLIAKEFNLDYLDTGLLYRAVGYFMLKANLTTNNLKNLINISDSLDIKVIHTLDLQNEKIATAASIIAKIPEIRKALYLKQVNFANNPSDNKKGTVLDGRDIGTAICPNADIKFFFIAPLEIRAQRRYEQLKLLDSKVKLIDIYNAIKNRDERDKYINDIAFNSKESIIIDNTNLTLNDTFKVCKKYIENTLK